MRFPGRSNQVSSTSEPVLPVRYANTSFGPRQRGEEVGTECRAERQCMVGQQRGLAAQFETLGVELLGVHYIATAEHHVAVHRDSLGIRAQQFTSKLAVQGADVEAIVVVRARFESVQEMSAVGKELRPVLTEFGLPERADDPALAPLRRYCVQSPIASKQN